MEIITAYSKGDLEAIITDAVQNCLKGLKTENKPIPDDRIGISEASNITGFTQSTIYRKVHDKEIPFKKFGKRLVFSRNELQKWMEKQTIIKPNASERMADRLAKDAMNKNNRN